MAVRFATAIFFLTVCPGMALASGGDVRARAAEDLACKAIKIQDWGQKVEARGCGRNAEYERSGGTLDLVMVEREVTPEMRRQAAADLECSSGGVEVTRTWTKELGEQAGASGCGGDVTYDTAGGQLTLKMLNRPAPADVAAKVAADLGCPSTIQVTLTREGNGAPTAGAYDCKDKDKQFYRYSLSPFKRVTDPTLVVKPETRTMVGIVEGDVEEVARTQKLKQRAAQDLGCNDPNGIVLTLTKESIKVELPGGGGSDDLKAMEAKGCGRHAKYERRQTSGLTLTYIEAPVKPEVLGQISKEHECPVASMEVHQYSFPDRGGPSHIGVRGCDRQASYEIGPAGLKLLYQISKAPPDVVRAIASDLGCLPERAKVDLVRTTLKAAWSAAANCEGGHRYMYNLQPTLKRIGRAPVGQ